MTWTAVPNKNGLPMQSGVCTELCPRQLETTALVYVADTLLHVAWIGRHSTGTRMTKDRIRGCTTYAVAMPDYQSEQFSPSRASGEISLLQAEPER